MKKIDNWELISWCEQFILKVNKAKITNDNGNSFQEIFQTLIEELYLKIT